MRGGEEEEEWSEKGQERGRRKVERGRERGDQLGQKRAGVRLGQVNLGEGAGLRMRGAELKGAGLEVKVRDSSGAVVVGAGQGQG